MISPLSVERVPDADPTPTPAVTAKWLSAAGTSLVGLAAVFLSMGLGSLPLMFFVGATFGLVSGAILERLWTAIVGLIFGLLSPIAVLIAVIFVDIIVLGND